MLIEALCPLTVRLPDGEVHLDPGMPIDLPEEHATRLLEKLPHKVRRVDERPLIEPAAPNARPVYWENADGVILGPAVPEFLAQAGQQFWVIVQHEAMPRWVRADRLRSKQAFEKQVSPVPFERIKDVR